jgi:hypothetical protein
VSGNAQFGTGFYWDNTNGRLGIGTSTPAVKAHVVYNDNTFLNGLYVQNTSVLSSSYTGIGLQDAGGSVRAGFQFIPSTFSASQLQNTVIFASTTQSKLGFIANSGAIGSTAQDIYFSTLGSNTTYQMQIKGNGNIQIGTTTDAGFKLDVNGTARVSGNTVVTSWLGVGGVTTPTGSGEKFNVQGAQVISGASGAGNFLLYQISGASRFIVGSEASIGGTANNYINYVYGNNSYITYTNNVARLSVTGGGNVLINTTTDIASSKLTIESTTQGVLFPRMTTTEKNAIATPATGLQIYDSTLNRPCFYDGTSWITL